MSDARIFLSLHNPKLRGNLFLARIICRHFNHNNNGKFSPNFFYEVNHCIMNFFWFLVFPRSSEVLFQCLTGLKTCALFYQFFFELCIIFNNPIVNYCNFPVTGLVRMRIDFCHAAMCCHLVCRIAIFTLCLVL